MKKSELREIIREEISNLLLESKNITVFTSEISRKTYKSSFQIADELYLKLKKRGYKPSNVSSFDESTVKSMLRTAYEDARRKWNSTMGNKVVLTTKGNDIFFTPKQFSWKK